MSDSWYSKLDTESSSEEQFSWKISFVLHVLHQRGNVRVERVEEGGGRRRRRRRRRRRGLYLIKPPGAELIEHQYPVVLWLIESPADVDCIISLLNSSPSVPRILRFSVSARNSSLQLCRALNHLEKKFASLEEDRGLLYFGNFWGISISMLDRHLTRDWTMWTTCYIMMFMWMIC